jgi:hypothetical protein
LYDPHHFPGPHKAQRVAIYLAFGRFGGGLLTVGFVGADADGFLPAVVFDGVGVGDFGKSFSPSPSSVDLMILEQLFNSASFPSEL